VRRAGGPVNVKSDLNEAVDDLLNLFLARSFLHHDNHVKLLSPFILRSDALDPSTFVDDSLKQAPQAFIVQRAVILAANIFDDFALAFRIVNTHVQALFDLSDFDGAPKSLVQKFDQLPIDIVNPISPIVDTHMFTVRPPG
jgi:hypothetical protein